MNRTKGQLNMGISSIAFRVKWPIAVATLATLLVSCSSVEEKPAPEPAPAAPEQAAPEAADSTSAELASSASELAVTAQKESKAEPILYRGNDRQVNLPPPRPAIKFVGDGVSLNFEQAPMSEVMHAILSDILKLDYVVDNPVQGQVTLRSRTPVPRDQLLGVLESLLKANNAVMIRDNNDRFLITGSQHGTKIAPRVSTAASGGAGFSISVIPLQYISAANMAEILKPVADEGSFVRIDNRRNLLMMAGTRAQHQGWQEMISTFDIDLLEGMSVGFFPLENSSSAEINTALQGLLGGGGTGGVGDFSHLVRIVPVERLNGILVVTPRVHYLGIVEKWIVRLDRVPDSNFEKRLYVYPVQNTTAGRLAGLLSNIYSGGGGGVKSATTGGGGISANDYAAGAPASSGTAPGMSRESIGSSGITKGAANFATGASAGGGMTTTTVGGKQGSSLQDVKVVADDENNALMIYATGKDYKIIEVALEQLDVVATQVIIEASIIEVSLTDDLKYGLEWTFNNSLGNSYDGLGVLAAAAEGPAAIAPGFSYTVTNSIGDISAVLNALSEQSLINVISSPSVMVVDNHTAYIHVGDQVPTFSAQTITDGGRTTQSVEYRDTGVKLSVRPSVNAGGLVTMDVEQSVTDVGTIDAATGQRSFLERNIMSRVAVRSNESVVLGGLIRENASTGDAGVPFLHTIPVVGGLFGTKTESTRRTELLVIITPRALYNESELREVSAEMRSQIRHMELIDLPPE